MNERETDYKQLGRERMISLVDWFEEILRRIWLIIVLAVIFAVLCAGWKYMSDRAKADAAANADAKEEVTESLSAEQMSEVNSVLQLYRETEAADRYLSESIRMQIDPYQEDRVTMQFALQAEDASRADVLQLLETYVARGALAADLQDRYSDVESRFLTELLSFSSSSLSTVQSGTEIELMPSSVFTVQVIEEDEEAALQLADAVQECLASYTKGLGSSFGQCSLKLLDQSVAQVYDSGLLSDQMTALNNQITQQNKIATQTDALSSEQQAVLETLLAQADDTDLEGSGDTAVQETTAAKVHISRRYVLIGVIIGIVLGFIVITLYYLGRGTLNVAREMPGEFGLSLFGQVHIKRQRNPLVRGWRRLVSKKKALPPETEWQIVSSNLKAFCKEHDVHRILFTGSRQDLTESEGLQDLSTALAAEGITAEVAGGLLDSPETLDRLQDFPYLVLIETLHKSQYMNVVRETELCTAREVPIAGAIVLD